MSGTLTNQLSGPLCVNVPLKFNSKLTLIKLCVCVCVYLCTCRSVSSLSNASTTSISRTVRKTGGGFFAALN